MRKYNLTNVNSLEQRKQRIFYRDKSVSEPRIQFINDEKKLQYQGRKAYRVFLDTVQRETVIFEIAPNISIA